ncbi:bifunctional homocysteine S-methyltransferase/methylenetetrahydrofolate reductase [Fimbriimonadia bacterium ATM]|nr:MAG: bifunctional homocysteine S-methyltransferase/methylenetetrahydrofolate reductase [Armatimonadota bacterium]MBC6969491.1 bifunctional homocysteine S-methyltransferase/methylenetetrahydrofolate reductase [Armatimonadota bacterium]MCE7899171.1 bifunctional homocysteine S-methyltransferase/methylenetetrahydrofolate reductase [Armatimonadetes bacterium ATM1]MDL1928953.1 bifunctional homocysteine S-methyltransferase/methylenetetrahydrofolate reductase [Fimbriimonadia bacterium ATM]RIJ97238.1
MLEVTLLEALRERVLVLDGAMGTQLTALGYEGAPLALANLERPDIVRRIHDDYLTAGADVIETNTFWLNSFRLSEMGCIADPVEICAAGARIAREAAGDRFVLGSIGPCGKPLIPLGPIDLEAAKREFVVQAEALLSGGVDGILLESFSDLEELLIAIRVVRPVCQLPLFATKSFIEDGETLAEGFPLRAAQRILDAGADGTGANCVVGPQRMFDIVRWMAEVGDAPIIAMPTPGMPQLVKGEPVYDVTPAYFGEACARLAEAGANIIGGCCGTTPEHIRATVASLRDRRPRKRVHQLTAEAESRRPIPESEPSRFSQKLGKEFVITVELDLPRGLDTDKVLHSSAVLHERGADLIDISDGARARLRMTPVAICALIQNAVGIEAMMHVACRDRNLLALQADLLGAHALGIRNVLAVTGDPANIGDFPSATSVFDIDSVGLVRILSRFNEGRDMAGNTVGRKCAFTIAIAFNPLARDMALETDRLTRKADAGAHVIYTQPIFEKAHLDAACEAARRVGLPILIGVMPLRNRRHAEFMHNEVPGIEIPDWVRARMGEVSEEAAPEVGIEIAQEFAQCLPGRANGMYVMPPFGNPTVAIRVMEAIGR